MFPQLYRPIAFDKLEHELRYWATHAGIHTYDVTLNDDLTAEHERDPRRYAAATLSASPPTFFFAEQTLWLPYPHRLGLYVHEIGHVLDPDPDKTEEGADATGMAACGVLLVYDLRWPGKGLQTALLG